MIEAWFKSALDWVAFGLSMADVVVCPVRRFYGLDQKQKRVSDRPGAPTPDRPPQPAVSTASRKPRLTLPRVAGGA